ncbi:hypothetical protein CONLIGDRAFT_454163 [Coniochaeta ligniaria NRRL 30616]|uniref:Peptidase A1 domain-containing protein n=1 Tax=Coniochaeta ligniaria NRRL 30616 TaxID=1408157 RepID=A0A1J7IKA9_9PEZI|nr:hypothetical protein CONLIGDRAFT_454163 [Coniochaeta ligniaria NRRL 30616]
MGHTNSISRAPRAQIHTHILTILFISSTRVLAACSPEPIFLPLDNCTINLPNQPTIHSWGAPISVSSSESSDTLQYLCGVPSTVLNTTFYTTSLLCSDDNIRAQNLTYAQCLSRRGGGLGVDSSGQPSGPDALQTTSTSGLADSDAGWVTIMKPDDPFPAAVLATLHLHGRDMITTAGGLIESGNNHTTTHVSLGDHSALLSALASAGRIAARSFSFDAGSQSHSAPRAGGLVLGGWDDGARAGTEVHFDMAEYKENHQLNGKRTCPLQVTIASMVLRPAGGDGSTDYNLGIEPAHPQQACLEMYDNYPRLPASVINSLKDGFAAFTGSTEQPVRYAATSPAAPPSNDALARQLEDIYIPEPGLIYTHNNLTASFNGSLVIMLADNNFTVEIPVEELCNPVRGIARDGTRVVNGNFTELAVYQDPAPEDAAVLGKVFLSRAYLYVDYDKGEFTLTQSASSGRTILVATGDDGTSCAGGGSGWSRVTIALVAVVAVLGLALLGILACFLIRRRRSDRAITWPWRRERKAQGEPRTGVNGRPREDHPEGAQAAPVSAPMPVPERSGIPLADITPVRSEPTVLPHPAVQPRSLSEDTGDSRFRPYRIGRGTWNHPMGQDFHPRGPTT